MTVRIEWTETWNNTQVLSDAEAREFVNKLIEPQLPDTARTYEIVDALREADLENGLAEIDDFGGRIDSDVYREDVQVEVAWDSPTPLETT